MKLSFFTMPIHPVSKPLTQCLSEDREAFILADRLGFSDAMLRELRLLSLLNRGWAFDGGLGIADALATACAKGRASIGLGDGGVIAVDEPADFLLLHIDAIDRDGLDRDGSLGADIRHFLINRATLRTVVEVIADGRTIIENGQAVGMDIEAMERELRAQHRAALPGQAPVIDAWRQLEPKVRRFYGDHSGCC